MDFKHMGIIAAAFQRIDRNIRESLDIAQVTAR